MAKISTVVKNKKRKQLADRYREKRKTLKLQAIDPNLSEEKREAAFMALQKLPRNSSYVRYKNRCELTGRGRSYNRAFALSRIKLRELALEGMLPGIIKASW